MEAIKIFKGDDSDFMNLRPITFAVDAAFSLNNCKAVFRCQGYREVIPDISSGNIEITLPQEATRRFKTGECYGTLHLVDAEGRRLTIINDLLFDVIRDIDEISQIGAEFNVTITINPLVITVASATDPETVVGSGDVYTLSGYTPITDLNMYDCTHEQMTNFVGGLFDTLESAKVINDSAGVSLVMTGEEYGLYELTPIYALDLSVCNQSELGRLLTGLCGSLIKSKIINSGVTGDVIPTNDSYYITGYESIESKDLEDCTFEELCNLVGSAIESLKKSGVVQ